MFVFLGYLWVFAVQILQVMPFLYFCYLFYTFLQVFFPMLGRFGHGTNPDLLIGLICALGTFFALGFVVSFLSFIMIYF